MKMLNRLAKTALVGVLLLGASCENFTWSGRGGDVEAEAAARGVQDVESLRNDYETQRFWARQRECMAGRADSFWNGLGNIVETFDRSFLNYSRTDPYRRVR